MEWLIISLYALSLLIICLFSLNQFNLAWNYLRAKKRCEEANTELTTFPQVTIQLPVYNEKYVAERLLKAIAQIDYPRDKLEIQVLDDSTDETKEIIANKVRDIAALGMDIQHICRANRIGFKAGALQYGLRTAKGAFIAIFDADFLPQPDFLLSTLPKFSKEQIGMVQSKWSHINKDFGALTKAQAFWLDGHFTVEQKGREVSGSFLNFNGTAGVWRRRCIEDAGGWQHDTLTEDLDLSYRAQLRGWKFVYREDIESPAELPVFIPAVKSQQYRWNKGAAETAKKIIGNVLRSDLSFTHKLRATFHLFNSSVFVLLMIAAILSIPMLYIKELNPQLGLVFDLGSIFIIGFLAMGFSYWVSAKATRPENTLEYFIPHFLLFLAFSMGLALHNSIAVIEGYLGIKTPFIRTPKFNIKSKNDSFKGNKYLRTSITPVTIFEGLLAVYFIFGIFSGIKLEDYGLLFFHAMMAIGFAYIFFLSVIPISNES